MFTQQPFSDAYIDKFLVKDIICHINVKKKLFVLHTYYDANIFFCNFNEIMYLDP